MKGLGDINFVLKSKEPCLNIEFFFYKVEWLPRTFKLKNLILLNVFHLKNLLQILFMSLLTKVCCVFPTRLSTHKYIYIYSTFYNLDSFLVLSFTYKQIKWNWVNCYTLNILEPGLLCQCYSSNHLSYAGHNLRTQNDNGTLKT